MLKRCLNPLCEKHNLVTDGEIVKFCNKCGNELSGLEKCPNCKTPILPADKFCINCGNEL